MVNFSRLKENLISFGFSESPYPIYLIDKSSNSCVNVNMPNIYGPYPKLSQTPNGSYFSIANYDVILMYYQGLSMDLYIKTINGHKPFIGNFKKQKCNYCNTNIHNNINVNKSVAKYYNYDDDDDDEIPDAYIDKPIIKIDNKTINKDDSYLKDESYYYCSTCQNAMCPLCYTETNYHIAFQHKVNMKQFEKRLPRVLDCIENHDMIYISADSIITPCKCNLCNTTINIFSNNKISESLNIYGFSKNVIQWYSNRSNDYDICMNCSLNTDGKVVIQKNNLKIINYKPICDLLDFGSILDWIPVYVSNSSDFILYNLNTESHHYKRMAYCHNNNGFHISYMDENISLDSEMDIIKMESRILNCTEYENTITTLQVKSIDSLFEYNIMNFTSSYNENNISDPLFSNSLFSDSVLDLSTISTINASTLNTSTINLDDIIPL